MDINGISGSLLQQINNTSTRTGDAVSISVMRKALDIQSSQAQSMIESAKAPQQTSAPAAGGLGQFIDTYA